MAMPWWRRWREGCKGENTGKLSSNGNNWVSLLAANLRPSRVAKCCSRKPYSEAEGARVNRRPVVSRAVHGEQNEPGLRGDHSGGLGRKETGGQ